MERREKIKIVFLGESNVGKTNIINCFCGRDFITEAISTISCNYIIKEFKIDNKYYTLDLWDTPGQEKFRSITNLFMKGTGIFIMVYDITNRYSFQELEYWNTKIKEMIGNNCVIGLIGNKQDLYLEEKISKEEGLEFAKSNSFSFTLLSAKESIKSLDYFIEDLVKRYLELRPERESIHLRDEEEERKRKAKRKTCCQNEIYYPFMERFKGRVFPWYLPIWEFRNKKKNTLI